MAFDPLQEGAIPVKTTAPATSSGFNPVASGATPVKAPVVTATTATPAPSASFDPVAMGATPVTNPAANILNAASQGAKSGWNDDTNQSINPADWGNNVEKAYQSTFNDVGNKIYDVFNNWKTDNTLEKVSDAGEAGLGVVNAFLSPITIALKGVESVPVVGYVAKGVNALFGAIGGGAGQAGVDILQQLPLSDKDKANLEPIVRDASALAGQLVAGKAGADITDVASQLHDHVQTILSTLKNKADIATPVSDAISSEISNKTAPSETAPASEPVAPTQNTPLVDSTGKQDIRTVMEGLGQAGYDKNQLATIMGKIIENNNTGRFTPKEVSDVARQYTPTNRDYPVSRVNKGDTSKPYTFKTPPKTGDAPIAEPTPKISTESAPVSPDVTKSNLVKISQATDDGKDGKFWTKPEGVDSSYGTKRNDAFVDSSKLYKGKSSLQFLKDRNLLTPEIQEKIDGASEGGDPNLEYKIPQDIAEAQLKKEGYSGAHWTSEDDLNPTQYQIWDKSVVKGNPEEVTKNANEASPEKVNTDAKILENHFKDDPQFKGTTFKEQSEIFNQLLSEDRAKLFDIATEKIPTERGAVPSAMAELLAKDKNLTGEEAARLGKTPFATSKGGQALSLSRIADGDSTLDNLQKATEVKKGGEKTQSKIKAETKTAKETISKTRAKLLNYEEVLKKITC